MKLIANNQFFMFVMGTKAYMSEFLLENILLNINTYLQKLLQIWNGMIWGFFCKYHILSLKQPFDSVFNTKIHSLASQCVLKQANMVFSLFLGATLIYLQILCSLNYLHLECKKKLTW